VERVHRYTIKDVAKAAGVSKTTVSRYLNKQFDRMSEETKERIEDIIQDLDYVPNRYASSLTTKRSGQIGVVVGDIYNMYSTALLKGIGQVTHKAGSQILIANGAGDLAQEKQVLLNMLSQGVDGIVLQPATGDADHYAFLKQSNIPVVLVDRITQPLLFPCITSNDISSAEKMARIMLDRNYENILVVVNPIDRASVRYERYRGVAQVARAAGKPISLLEVENDVVDGIGQWLTTTKAHHPAIFAANGRLLLESLRWLQKNQISVPDEVGLCGYDDWDWTDLANPPLTVINQHPEKIGEAVAEKLMQKISGVPVSISRTQLPADIIIRSSL
jgi:LacI family kdg operon repressor